jgi:hypothetical protein
MRIGESVQQRIHALLPPHERRFARERGADYSNGRP